MHYGVTSLDAREEIKFGLASHRLKNGRKYFELFQVVITNNKIPCSLRTCDVIIVKYSNITSVQCIHYAMLYQRKDVL